MKARRHGGELDTGVIGRRRGVFQAQNAVCGRGRVSALMWTAVANTVPGFYSAPGTRPRMTHLGGKDHNNGKHTDSDAHRVKFGIGARVHLALLAMSTVRSEGASVQTDAPGTRRRMTNPRGKDHNNDKHTDSDAHPVKSGPC